MFDFEEAVKIKPEIIEGKSQQEIEELSQVVEPLSKFMSALFDINNKKKMDKPKLK